MPTIGDRRREMQRTIDALRARVEASEARVAALESALREVVANGMLGSNLNWLHDRNLAVCEAALSGAAPSGEDS